MGSTTHANWFYGELCINIISTPEFGLINIIKILKGVIGEKKEVDYFTIMNINKYKFRILYEVFADKLCYFRCEVKTDADDLIFAISNPIWFYP